MVSPSEMTQAEGIPYCSGRGMTLAAIYNTAELSTARNAISSAGVQKAITSATSDGNGWRWGSGGARWLDSGFPLNTGKVTDQRNGMAGGIYSLHRAGGSFVWDADGAGERHRVLCRSGAAPPPPPAPPTFTYHAGPASFAGARRLPVARGDLASIHSASENAEAAALANRRTRG